MTTSSPFAKLPEPPYYAVIFSSQRNTQPHPKQLSISLSGQAQAVAPSNQPARRARCDRLRSCQILLSHSMQLSGPH